MARLFAFAALIPALAFAAPTVAMNGHLPSASDSASIKALGGTAVRQP